MEQSVPKGLRLHIVLLGRSNVGKSSLVNALAGQDVSLVSAVPGTTGDPVEMTLEMAPIGPVVLLDTAGLDEVGALGGLRARRSLRAARRADVALLVTERGAWGPEERRLAALLEEMGIPFAVARNKMDTPQARLPRPHDLAGTVPVLDVSARLGLGLEALRLALEALAPEGALDQPPLLSDLLPEQGLALLVVPLDSGAPKGRLILPQAQAIRDILDGRRLCAVATDAELPAALDRLRHPPDLVVCDSQVVAAASRALPADIPLTTFSVLMARRKGDLAALARGAAALERLRPGDRVRVQEACSHHPQKDDIARVKLPRLLRRLAGGDLEISVGAGKAFPVLEDGCGVIVHCGGCVITRGQMLARQRAAEAGGCPMTNFGMAISLAQGVLERVLSPFPEALRALEDGRAARR